MDDSSKQKIHNSRLTIHHSQFMLRQYSLLILALLVLGIVGTLSMQESASLAQAQTEPTATLAIVNEITEPKKGDAIFGFTAVKGSALIHGYRRHEVHISVAGNERWQWLAGSQAIIRQDTIYRLDTTRFPDGLYDLRVRAIRDDGNYNESVVRAVEIRNINPPTLTPVPTYTATFNELGTPQPISPLPTAEPKSPIAAPTPTTDTTSRVPGGQGFYAPDNGERLSGSVPIVATVNGFLRNPFRRYELAISVASHEDWQWLFGASRQYWQKPIYTLDTTEFSDGFYDLRLRIVYRDSNYNEYFLRNLQIFNRSNLLNPSSTIVDNNASNPLRPGIYYPQSGTRIEGIVNFIGTAIDPNLSRWELSWSPSNRESWSFLLSSDKAVANDLLARLDLSQMPLGTYDFRLRIVHENQNYNEYFVRRLHISPTKK